MLKARACRFIAMSCLGALAACGESYEKSLSSDSTLSIIQGTETKEFPAVGAMMLDGEFMCSATLIAANQVLTAAHCVDLFADAEPLAEIPLTFIVGPGIEEIAEMASIRELRIAPQYERLHREHDLAVATLERNLMTAPMPIMEPSHDSIGVGDSLLFVGFGFTSAPPQRQGGGRKTFASIPIIEKSAALFKIGGSSNMTCSGDSGGAVLHTKADHNYEILAVISGGSRNCRDLGVNVRLNREEVHEFIQASGPREKI